MATRFDKNSALALNREASQTPPMFAYALTIFLGAFLLFQVQPLIGKYILPWFGGGPGVWTTCMLFFQVLLLGGYAYAHLSSRLLKPRAQASVHLVLLAAALSCLPITPADSWKPGGGGNPAPQILGLLTVCLGLPYFVLSATGPLMQQWFSRTNPGRSPYRLYALSNIGSLLALVSYPFFFETRLTRIVQAKLWGWALVGYVLFSVFCALRVWRASSVAKFSKSESNPSEPRPAAVDPRSSTLDRILWLLLPACASVLLLAVTNKLCQDVAVIPFLWVLPLALYLLSFVICFDNPRWYGRGWFTLAWVAALVAMCWALFKGVNVPIRWQVAIYSAGLLLCCMICHGELYRLRPAPGQLTGFYLMIAAGGALGGVFVVAIAPFLFADYYELHWGLVLCGLLLTVVCAREESAADRSQSRWLWHWLSCACLALGVLALGAVLWYLAHKADDRVVSRSRNFYGTLRVCEYRKNEPDGHYFLLQHGRITHGLQFVDPHFAMLPTTYYGKASGIALGVGALPEGPRRIGVVGLGTGSMAVFGRRGDTLRIYEINREVQRVATSRFTYLSNCPAQIEIVRGDARLSLEREPPQHFDLLALDAFNSDAIPVHLLTKEAFEVYQRHVKTNGVIAVHISNHYLNLEPVVMNLAQQLDYRLAIINYEEDQDDEEEDAWWEYSSTWILLSRDQRLIDSPAIRQAASKVKTNMVSIPLWTDDFASVFQILQ